MKLQLTVQSALLSSSGESTAHIDADVKYDKYGFPYIQGKTFKGLLRESATEVCEMEGTDYNRVKNLFGVQGSKESSMLFFNDLRLAGYEQIISSMENNAEKIDPFFVRSFFTTIRKQTSLKDGIAEETSLRSYRLIKENTIFETQIEGLTEDTDDLHFIKNALLNLRYIGVRRNRGFGNVKIVPVTESKNNAEVQTQPIQIGSDADVSTETAARLRLKIYTLDNVLFSKVVGEQNTVSTDEFIPARNIWGLVANLILKNQNEQSNAHSKENVFHKLILSGKIRFHPAFIGESIPIPGLYGYNKTFSESVVKNMFEVTGESLKAIKGFATIQGTELKKHQVNTSFSFHNSRKDNRLAGKSTSQSGAIFYYEGLDKGQCFETEIIGPRAYLNIIRQLLNQNNGVHRLGRSKTAQYGKVRFVVSEPEVINDAQRISSLKNQISKNPGSVYLVFITPVLLLNDMGMALPDLGLLESELKSVLGDNVSIEKCISSAAFVENYMGTWKTKTQRESGFEIGTTIKISCNKEPDVDFLNRLVELENTGIGDRKNEGYGIFRILDLPNQLTIVDHVSRESALPGSDLNNITTPECLKILYQQYKMEKLKDAVRIKALNRRPKVLPNSLISRMKINLERGESAWKGFITDIDGKKAWKTLKDAGLWDELKSLKTPDYSDDFELKREYWLTYFKMIRRKNKAEHHE